MNRPSTTIRRTSLLWRYASLLGLLGLLCGVLLGGLSAWFLSSVAIAGLSAAAFTFNFHIPGALVRLFALSRTAARYGERLVGHKAALNDQSARRRALFARMARGPGPRRAGWQLADQSRLTEYLDDVEDLDFATLRADLPARFLAIGFGGLIVATAWTAPLALIPIALVLLVLVAATRRQWDHGKRLLPHMRSLRRSGARDIGALLGSVVPLKAERDWADRFTAALDHFGEADRAESAVRRCQALVDALAGLLGPIAAVGIVGISWSNGLRGKDLLVPAFVAFAWIAFGDTAQGLARIVTASLRRQVAEYALDDVAVPPAAQSRSLISAAPSWLRCENLQRRDPTGRAIGVPETIDLRAGRPIILSGASGIGKTSLLKQIAGWIGSDTFESDCGAISAADRASCAMLCLHDAAILDDTVRANLFAPDADDEALWKALNTVELAERIRTGGGLDAWIGQDSLSLGEAQRLNLARAWLSAKPLILLDEPTEHLPLDQGSRILDRLAERLRDRILVISTHRRLTNGCGRILVLSCKIKLQV